MCGNSYIVFLTRQHYKGEREPKQAILKPPLGVPAEPDIIWRVLHPSTIQAQCCLTSVFQWELVYPTWQLCWLAMILSPISLKRYLWIGHLFIRCLWLLKQYYHIPTVWQLPCCRASFHSIDICELATYLLDASGFFNQFLEIFNSPSFHIFVCVLECLSQGILKGEVSLYHWPPVWLVWNQLYE